MKRAKKVGPFFFLTCTSISLLGCVPDAHDTKFTFHSYLSSSPSMWSPAYRSTTTESAIYELTEAPLIDFVLNEEKNGHKLIPEMAEELPIDCTDSLKDEEINRFGLERDSSNENEKFKKGQKWLIKLRKNATFEDGTPINADTYIESMKRILDPKMQTRRGPDYATGKTAIGGGEKYLFSGRDVLEPFFDKDGKQVKKDRKEKEGWYFDLYRSLPFMENGSSFFGLINDLLLNDPDAVALTKNVEAFGNESRPKAPRIDNNQKLRDDIYRVAKKIVKKKYGRELENKIEVHDANKDSFSLEAFLLSYFKNPDYDFKNVGIQKESDYSFYYYFVTPLSDFSAKEFFARNWIVKISLWDKLRKPVSDSGLFSTTYATSQETYCSYGPYKLTFFHLDKSFRMERNDKWIGYKSGLHEGKYQIDSFRYEIVKDNETCLQMFRRGELDSYAISDSKERDLFGSSKRIIYSPGTIAVRIVMNSVFSHLKEIQDREGKGNHTILANKNFRKALSLGFDRKTFCQTQSAAWVPFSVPISPAYLSDPENNVAYRDTKEGKKVVTSHFGADSNGEPNYNVYNIEKARELIRKAVEEEDLSGKEGSYKKGNRVHFVWESMDLEGIKGKRIDWAINGFKELCKGTALENKLVIEKRASGRDSMAHMRAGTCDFLISGWTGSINDPFGLMEAYTYTSSMIEPYPLYKDVLKINLKTGEYGGANEPVVKGGPNDIESMSIGGDGNGSRGSWIYELNSGKYNSLRADASTRLKILSALEGYLVGLHNFIVIGCTQGMTIDSYRLKRGSDKYLPFIGFGGVRDMRLLKNNGDWKKWANSHRGRDGFIDYNK